MSAIALRCRFDLRPILGGALLALSLGAAPAHADPLEGTWVGAQETLAPNPSPHSYNVSSHGGAITVIYDCASGRCTATLPVREFALGQFVTGGFSPPGPRQYFLMLPNSACVSRYGANAMAGVWMNLGSGPSPITECFATEQILGPSSQSGQRPRNVTPLRVQAPRIPPYVLRQQFVLPQTPSPPPPPKRPQ